jgi:hypothetical protein
MPGVHAKYSPSHAAIWGTCTASVEAEKGFPDTGSSYAEEGTLAHAIAEVKLKKRFGLISDSEYKTALADLRADTLYQSEMEGYTDEYVDEITRICTAFPEKPYIVVEKRLDMGHIVPDCFGTADCVVFYGDTLHIFDFKYGKGVAVSAEKNPQLRLYALGAVKEYTVLGEINTVRTHIIQPRLGNISAETLGIEELTAWGDALGRRVRDSLITGGEFVAGEHCRFCKARAVCRERAKSLLTLEEPKARADGGETLSDEEIGDILRRAQMLDNWVKALEDHALGKLLHGGKIPGWKLVEGRSVRTITDTEKAFAELTAAGFESDMLYERKPLGLTALEKLCGKKKLTELIGQYITKPSGKPTLVPESDKRKAFSQARLAEMFKDN